MKNILAFWYQLKTETIIDNNETITCKIKFIDTYRFIRGSLATHVDNLSEINNKDCKTCIVRKNIKLECKFIGFENNRLNHRCKECNGISAKTINDLIKRIEINFVMEILINLYYHWEKVYILMNTWIA